MKKEVQITCSRLTRVMNLYNKGAAAGYFQSS